MFEVNTGLYENYKDLNVKIKILLVLPPLFLFLNACTTTKLSFNQEKIILTNNSNQIDLTVEKSIYKHN